MRDTSEKNIKLCNKLVIIGHFFPSDPLIFLLSFALNLREINTHAPVLAYL